MLTWSTKLAFYYFKNYLNPNLSSPLLGERPAQSVALLRGEGRKMITIDPVDQS